VSALSLQQCLGRGLPYSSCPTCLKRVFFLQRKVRVLLLLISQPSKLLASGKLFKHRFLSRSYIALMGSQEATHCPSRWARCIQSLVQLVPWLLRQLDRCSTQCALWSKMALWGCKLRFLFLVWALLHNLASFFFGLRTFLHTKSPGLLLPDCGNFTSPLHRLTPPLCRCF